MAGLIPARGRAGVLSTCHPPLPISLSVSLSVFMSFSLLFFFLFAVFPPVSHSVGASKAACRVVSRHRSQSERRWRRRPSARPWPLPQIEARALLRKKIQIKEDTERTESPTIFSLHQSFTALIDIGFFFQRCSKLISSSSLFLQSKPILGASPVSQGLRFVSHSGFVEWWAIIRLDPHFYGRNSVRIDVSFVITKKFFRSKRFYRVFSQHECLLS